MLINSFMTYKNKLYLLITVKSFIKQLITSSFFVLPLVGCPKSSNQRNYHLSTEVLKSQLSSQEPMGQSGKIEAPSNPNRRHNFIPQKTATRNAIKIKGEERHGQKKFFYYQVSYKEKISYILGTMYS